MKYSQHYVLCEKHNIILQHKRQKNFFVLYFVRFAFHHTLSYMNKPFVSLILFNYYSTKSESVKRFCQQPALYMARITLLITLAPTLFGFGNRKQ